MVAENPSKGLFGPWSLFGDFRKAGALDRNSARPLSEMNVEDSVEFRRLAGQGIFVNTRDDLWYLHEESVQKWRRKMWGRTLLIVAVIGGIVALLS